MNYQSSLTAMCINSSIYAQTTNNSNFILEKKLMKLMAKQLKTECQPESDWDQNYLSSKDINDMILLDLQEKKKLRL